MVERAGLAVLHRINPEIAHGLALRALQTGLVPLPGLVTSARLRTELGGLSLANPIGLAAGFDKNAVVLAPLSRAGFGFVEAGATTPRPQPGNQRPRLYRLGKDRAVINRFGFNNNGMQAMATHLAMRPKDAVIGLNLGANKDSADRAGDFARVLAHCGQWLDFATVNVSSPNTERLRDLQGKAALAGLLDGVMTARDGVSRDNQSGPLPIFLKIAPDMELGALKDIADVAMGSGISGIIATNTTLDRSGLRSAHAAEPGGLSGQPLFDRSTRVLARLSLLTKGQMPLIGVGGVGSAEQAYAKIRAGASAVQLYTALIYSGLSLVPKIARGLDDLLARDGFETVAEAVGTDRESWL
ncbi:quinone-dependent dihydroorotate dehydrogenase [Puniceibacterium sp. IMCC21224]|uniref:quinone-dependent dihydroorotate dehydrogenase n=1 Tax=Puniceibacterium sp. IMCC21224 TaxID=1618204 RepID=UPI0009E265BD|nr:quinone-dependent dihydroorotate dehydrogenase [Puniceibacterium sp. IMCC21224]